MKTEITTRKQVKAYLLILFLCGTFFSGFSQSLTITTPDATICEGGYKYIYANFTPPTNIANYVSYQITAVRWYKSGPYGTTLIPSNLYGYLSCYTYETGRYYCQIDYSIRTSYQYVTSTYCCQSGPFGTCKKYCNNYATGYNTQNYYQLWANNSCYITVNPKSYTTQNISICSNSLPYNWNGYSLYSEGSYTTSLHNTFGCDSVITLNLSVGTSGATSYDSAIVCSSALPYSWNGLSLTAAGDYSQNFTSPTGCDSIANFKLIISAANTSSNYATVCSSSLPYLWNGISCDSAGTYSKIFSSPGGCDSVAVLNLTVHQTTSSVTNIIACQNAVPFWWNNKLVNVGTDTVNLTNAEGCDSLAIVNVTTKPVGTSTRTVNICPTDLPYAWNNSTYGAAGVYTQQFTTNIGCDSVATLNLIVNTPTSSTTNIGICQSALPYSWNGNSFTTPGIHNVHLTNADGCDSTATLNLYINSTSSTTQNISVCQNNLPYLWNGNSYSTAGTYAVHLNNSNGCDSSITLNLTIKVPTTSAITLNICGGDLPFSWNNNTFTKFGSYNVVLVNKAGCDSIITLTLNVKDQISLDGINSSVSVDTLCYATPVTFSAKLFVDSSKSNIRNNASFYYMWNINGLIKLQGNDLSTYSNNTLKNNDNIGCSINLFNTASCVTSGVKQKVIIMKMPNVVPSFTFWSSEFGKGYFVDANIGVLTAEFPNLCNLNAKYSLGRTSNLGVWTIQDTNIIKIKSLVVNGKLYDTVFTKGNNGLGIANYKYQYASGCSIDYQIKVVVDTAIITIPPITGPHEVCSNQNIQLTIADSSGFWYTGNQTYVINKGNGLFTGSYPTAYLGQNVGYQKNVRKFGSNEYCPRRTEYNIFVWPKPAINSIGFISGPANLCVGSSAQLGAPVAGGSWSAGGPTTVTSGGVVTPVYASTTAQVTYNVQIAHGCIAQSLYTFKSIALPAVPSIAYGAAAVNPQAGAGGGNNFCTNRTFTVVGSPAGGVWSKTGVLSVTNPGGFVSTGSVAGNGSITYTYTSAAGCSSSRSIVGAVVTCAARGVVDNSQWSMDNSQWTMYPNPAKSVININVETLIGKGNIVVTDLYGKTVKIQPLSMGTNTVDIANLSKGMYFVSTITSEGKTTKKLVVE
jgi:hypothetical protein